MCPAAAATPSPITNTAMRNTSGLPKRATSRSTHGTTQRAPTRTATTTPIAFPRRAHGDPFTATSPARSGTSKVRGTTMRSWKMSIPRDPRPCGASISARCCSDFSTMAVLLRAIRNPRNTASVAVRPRASDIPKPARAVSPICRVPPSSTMSLIDMSSRQRELDADGEEQEHHADLGHRFQFVDVTDEGESVRPDNHPGHEEPHDHRQLEPREDEGYEYGRPKDRDQVGEEGEAHRDASTASGWRSGCRSTSPASAPSR